MADDVTDPAPADAGTAADGADAAEAEATPSAPAADRPADWVDPSTGSSSATTGAPAVVRKKVTSKRVTPKGGAAASAKGGSAKASGSPSAGSKKSGNPANQSGSKRYTPPVDHKYDLPSPWWVPTLMFGMLIIGALIIMLNYMGVFGAAQNIRLVFGLAFILGGIVTATQLR